MQITTGQIAALIGGNLIGNPDQAINNVCKLNDGKPGAISFLANADYEQYIYTTTASAVLVADTFVPKGEITAVQIVVKDPHAAFVGLLEQYAKLQEMTKVGIEEPSYIGQNTVVGEGIYRGAFSYIGHNVTLGQQVKIHPHAYVGDNVTIGDGSIIHPGARILANTFIGKGCVVNAGCTIGTPGFGYQPQADGTYKAVPQLGNVVLEDNVEVGANTTIDRATMGSTLIKKGVKLDNLVQVGHNVTIGQNTVMASQSGIAGSSTIGANCIIGGQVGFSDHLKIADGSKFGAQTGVHASITNTDQLWMGSPMMPIKEYLRSVLHVQRLDKLAKRVNQLEQNEKRHHPEA